MINSGECPKCGSEKIAGPHLAVRFSISIRGSASLHALVCTECGYTEFYCDKKGAKNLIRFGNMYEVPQSKSTKGTPKTRPEESRVCLFCKSEVQSDAVICSECGREIF